MCKQTDRLLPSRLEPDIISLILKRKRCIRPIRVGMRQALICRRQRFRLRTEELTYGPSLSRVPYFPRLRAPKRLSSAGYTCLLAILTLCRAADVPELIRPLASVGRNVERQPWRAVNQLGTPELATSVFTTTRVAGVSVQAKLVLAPIRGQRYHWETKRMLMV